MPRGSVLPEWPAKKKQKNTRAAVPLCETSLSKAFVNFRSTGFVSPGQDNEGLAHLLPVNERQEKEAGKEETLVGEGNEAQQCARSRAESFSIEKSAQNCALAETLGRAEQAPQSEAVSIRDVDVKLLHQPRRQKFAREPEANP